MLSQQRRSNPSFWFIPGMLVCVLFLSALCLFFIHRQMNTEEERLHQIERFSLEQAQQLFRSEEEEKWQRAYRQFPQEVPEYREMNAWDGRLGEDILGFCLGNSGMLLYPAEQSDSAPDMARGAPTSPLSCRCKGRGGRGGVHGMKQSKEGQRLAEAHPQRRARQIGSAGRALAVQHVSRGRRCG